MMARQIRGRARELDLSAMSLHEATASFILGRGCHSNLRAIAGAVPPTSFPSTYHTKSRDAHVMHEETMIHTTYVAETLTVAPNRSRRERHLLMQKAQMELSLARRTDANMKEASRTRPMTE